MVRVTTHVQQPFCFLVLTWPRPSPSTSAPAPPPPQRPGRAQEITAILSEWAVPNIPVLENGSALNMSILPRNSGPGYSATGPWCSHCAEATSLVVNAGAGVQCPTQTPGLSELQSTGDQLLQCKSIL